MFNDKEILIMKRILAFLLMIVITASCMAACKDKKTSENSGGSGAAQKVDVSKESPDNYFIWGFGPESSEDSTIIGGLTEEGLMQKSIVIPAKCTELGSSAFHGADKLETIAFAGGDTIIQDNQFAGLAGMASLKTVVLPGNLVTIPDKCFSGSMVESVQVPASVTTIEQKAFAGCVNLKSIDLSQTSITTISYNAFGRCESLESVVLPDTVKIIEENAFDLCKSLKDINFPVGLEDIKNEAFRFCDSLQSVTLPESLVSVGSRAFGECPALEKAYLPATLQVIANDAFYKIALMEGYVQLTVYVKEGSFADTNFDDYYDGSMKKDFY